MINTQKTKFVELQDRIYKNMPAKKKLELLDTFYQTGKVLERLNRNGRKNSDGNFNFHRQNSRRS